MMRVNCRSIDCDLSLFLNIEKNDVSADKANMERWANLEMTTEELIEAVRSVNHIPRNVRINKKRFEEWVESLGYKRERKKSFIEYLTEDAYKADKAVLQAWEAGGLSTEYLADWIKHNNNMPSGLKIDLGELEKWANSLGYRRD